MSLHKGMEGLGVPPYKLEEVVGEREVWASVFRILPLRSGPDKQKKKDGWIITIFHAIYCS